MKDFIGLILPYYAVSIFFIVPVYMLSVIIKNKMFESHATCICLEKVDMIVNSKDADDFQIKDKNGRIIDSETFYSIELVNPNDDSLKYIIDVTEELYNNTKEGHAVKMYDVFLQYKGMYERRLLKCDDENIEKYIEEAREAFKESKSDILKKYQEYNNKTSKRFKKLYMLLALLMGLLFLMASYINS